MDTTGTSDGREPPAAFETAIALAAPAVLLGLLIAFNNREGPACWAAMESCSPWQSLLLIAILSAICQLLFSFVIYLAQDALPSKVIGYTLFKLRPSTLLAVIAGLSIYACIRYVGGIDPAWLAYLTPVGVFAGYVIVLLSGLALTVAVMVCAAVWRLATMRWGS